jgi:uracil-DNA glycosylase
MSTEPASNPNARWACHPNWEPTLRAFFAGPAGQQLKQRLAQRKQAGATVYPPQPLRALWLTPPEAVRVVIVGQDPYHQPGQAHGLAFSVAPGVPRPPSLRNILQEVARDCGTCTITDGCLEPWARQGVLLLNTVLTVEPSSPACHAGWGWEVLTDQIIYQLGQGRRPLVFMLWGAHAQAKKRLIDTQCHRVLTCNHPSPLAANRPPVPFVGCGHFGRANQWLQAQGSAPILW